RDLRLFPTAGGAQDASDLTDFYNRKPRRPRPLRYRSVAPPAIFGSPGCGLKEKPYCWICPWRRISKLEPSSIPKPSRPSTPLDDWCGNHAAVPIAPTEKT